MGRTARFQCRTQYSIENVATNYSAARNVINSSHVIRVRVLSDRFGKVRPKIWYDTIPRIEKDETKGKLVLLNTKRVDHLRVEVFKVCVCVWVLQVCSLTCIFYADGKQTNKQETKERKERKKRTRRMKKRPAIVGREEIVRVISQAVRDHWDH